MFGLGLSLAWAYSWLLIKGLALYFIRTFAFRFFESYLQRKAEAEKSEAEKSAGKAEKSSGKGKGVGKRSMVKEA